MQTMGVTISTHNRPNVCRSHNLRIRAVTDKESHIDPNGRFEVWHDEQLRTAYDRLFGEAVQEYNANQKRADRRISNYYNDIKNDVKKHLCYEMIIAIGSMKGERIDNEKGYAAMRKFVDTWQNRNPNLELVGAYYHADEEGVPHVHIDYVPVATGYVKGMRVQNGMVKALNNMGFETTHSHDTAQIKWERRENAYFEELVREQGYEVEHPEIEGRKHLDTSTYKREQQLETLTQHYVDMERLTEKSMQKAVKADFKASEAEAKKNYMQNEIKALRGELKAEKDLQKRVAGRTLIGTPRKRVSMSYEEYQTLTRFQREHADIDSEREKLRLECEAVSKAKQEAKEALDHAKTLNNTAEVTMKNARMFIADKVEKAIEEVSEALKRYTTKEDGKDISLWNYAINRLQEEREERERLEREQAEAEAAKKRSEMPQKERKTSLDNVKSLVAEKQAEKAMKEPQEPIEPYIRKKKDRDGR